MRKTRDLSLVWVTCNRALWRELRSSGHQAVLRNNLSGVWTIAKSAAWVFDHSSYDIVAGPLLFKKPRLVQLWHGIGPKTEPPRNAGWLTRTRMRRMFRTYDLITTTSLQAVPHYFDEMGLDTARVLPLGYPRQDMLFQYKNSLVHSIRVREWLAKLLDLALTSRWILLAPTWDSSWQDSFSFQEERLHAVLTDLDLYLVVRPHSFDGNGGFAVHNSSRIRLIASELVPDITDALFAFDILITDYSSIAYDFAILERPIIFFLHNYEKYMRERGLNFRVPDDYPGVIAYSFEEMLESLLQVCKGDNKEWQRRSRDVLRRFYVYHDGLSCHRIEQEIRKLLDLPASSGATQEQVQLESGR